MEFEMPASFGHLPLEILAKIFRHLDNYISLASCMLVNKHWLDVLVAQDELWREQCPPITTNAPVSVEQKPLPSYRIAAGHWHAFRTQYGDFSLRAAYAWHQIHQWLSLHSPPILASLRPGATEADLDEVERTLHVTLPPALRVLYRIHDGQDLEFDQQIDHARPSMGPSVFHGVFGGYHFYSHLVSTRMLPLRRMTRWTQFSRNRLNLPPDDRMVMFAAGYNFNKVIQCNTTTTQVFVSHIPAVKVESNGQGQGQQKQPPQDIVLRWFETYAQALASNRFRIEPLYNEVSYSEGISLFPRDPPLGATQITRGISVSAAPLFIAELSQNVSKHSHNGNGDNEHGDDNDGDEQYFFAYSIRFQLTSIEEQKQRQGGGEGGGEVGEQPFASVQLLDREWVIRNIRGGVESQVRGEAVVGEYPLLRAGGAHYQYQSCTHQREARGSMEGRFTFVEGSLESPGGRNVSAICPRFQLEFPDVVF